MGRLGPMEDSYDGKTGDDFDQLIDQLAAAARGHDQPELQRIYQQLAVPASLICRAASPISRG